MRVREKLLSTPGTAGGALSGGVGIDEDMQGQDQPGFSGQMFGSVLLEGREPVRGENSEFGRSGYQSGHDCRSTCGILHEQLGTMTA